LTSSRQRFKHGAVKQTEERCQYQARHRLPILYYLLLKVSTTPGIQLYNQKMTASISYYPPEIGYKFTAQGKNLTSRFPEVHTTGL